MKISTFGTALVAVAGLAAGAMAQTTTTSSAITVSLSFTEVDSSGTPVANPNGTVDFGESALISMGVSFTGQNTVGTFQPNIGTFGSGTIRGFGSGFFDLNGTNNAAGAWNVDQNAGLGASGDWDVTGGQGNGTPANGGANLQNLQFGQFAATPGGINTTNPIDAIWTGIWTPGDYSSRTVNFTTSGAAAAGSSIASVLFRLNSGTAAGAFVTTAGLTHGNLNIPVAPAPSSLALLGLGGLIAGRRRR